MATAYTTSLKLALPTQGELTGTWGDTLNNQVTSMVEEAVAGLKTIDTWSTNSATLSTADGSTSESRAAILSHTNMPYSKQSIYYKERYWGNSHSKDSFR